MERVAVKVGVGVCVSGLLALGGFEPDVDALAVADGGAPADGVALIDGSVGEAVPPPDAVFVAVAVPLEVLVPGAVPLADGRVAVAVAVPLADGRVGVAEGDCAGPAAASPARHSASVA